MEKTNINPQENAPFVLFQVELKILMGNIYFGLGCAVSAWLIPESSLRGGPVEKS